MIKLSKEFEKAYIGCVDGEPKISVYDSSEIIKILTKSGLSYEEAAENFDYNFESAKYNGAPIFLEKD